MHRELIPVVVAVSGLIILMLSFSVMVVVRMKMVQQQNYKEHLNEIAAERVYIMKWISRELHDDICALLGVNRMDLDQSIRSIPSAHNGGLKSISEGMGNLSHKVSHLAHALASTYGSNLTLEQSIRQLCGRVNNASKQICEFEPTGDERHISPKQSFHLIRVIQEAVFNAIKYAGTKVVFVRLSYDEDQLHLIIGDKGNGFELNKDDGYTGMGLKSMKERIGELKGRLDISSQPGVGTIIDIRCPWEHQSGMQKISEYI